MNGTRPPPLPGSSFQPKTSGLAVWSLVLGILSMTCFAFFTGLPGVICGHRALSKIRKSGGALTGQGLAIAGLVMGYLGCTLVTVFMIGLMAAIAIPNFVKARDVSMQNACINNLRQIEAAKNQWALEHNKQATDTPTESDLTPYLKNHQFPQCPAGGVYTIGQDSDTPTCSITNHVLQ
jgi:hypothetical protein